MNKDDLNILKPFMKRMVDENNNKIFMTRENPIQISSENERIGEINYNSSGTYMKIIDYRKARDIDVSMYTLLSNGDYKYNIRNTSYDHFKDSSPKWVYDRSVYGVGYLGEGPFSPRIHLKIYERWKRMLDRCYNSNYKILRPTYIGVKCDPWFHCFQNFAIWYIENYYEFEGEESHLDKDILIKGNKIYSPERYTLVPERINTLFTHKLYNNGLPVAVFPEGKRYGSKLSTTDGFIRLGTFDTPYEAFLAYKEAKESYIKKVANDYWYNKGGMYISQFKKVYDAMMNYVVEITD